MISSRSWFVLESWNKQLILQENNSVTSNIMSRLFDILSIVEGKLLCIISICTSCYMHIVYTDLQQSKTCKQNRHSEPHSGSCFFVHDCMNKQKKSWIWYEIAMQFKSSQWKNIVSKFSALIKDKRRIYNFWGAIFFKTTLHILRHITACWLK